MEFNLYVIYKEITEEIVIKMLKIRIKDEKLKGTTAGKKIRSWDEYASYTILDYQKRKNWMTIRKYLDRALYTS